MQYDVIGKMETARDDIRQVLKMTGFDEEAINPEVRDFFFHT